MDIVKDIVVVLSGKSMDDVEAAFDLKSNDSDIEKLIETVTALVLMLLQECNDPNTLAYASDIRLPVYKGILKAKLYKYLKKLDSNLNLKKVYEAFLDVGKKTPAEEILKMWRDVNE